ncbi:hypothetical protein, partial [Pseudomonas sp. MWU13-2100]|uniref:hypothetical protein n=1 Tax=Pseudomonas sp. MWU13-2100 TaxID=2935075 RepID=UPI002010ABF3
QLAQRNKELQAATSISETLSILTKWKRIDISQDIGTLTGFGKGFTEEMAKSGLGTLDSAANFMAHPLEGKAAIDEFILTADAQQILGDRYDQVKAQLASVDDALAQGGDVHSEKLGQQMGGLLAVFVTLVVGTEASAAKGASVLSKAGIDVSSSSYKVIAADATANSIRGRVDQLTAFGQGAK